MSEYAAEKNQATSKNILGFKVLMTEMFGRENKNSNYHNFLPDDQNNPPHYLLRDSFKNRQIVVVKHLQFNFRNTLTPLSTV